MSFRNQITTELGAWVRSSMLRSRMEWGKQLHDLGLSMAQVGVIGMLSHHEAGFGVREIAHRLHVSSAAASQLVDRLVQGGFVTRVESPADRRARLITLSEKGRALFSARAARPLVWVKQVADGLSEPEAKVVLSALAILHRIEAGLDAGGDAGDAGDGRNGAGAAGDIRRTD